MAHLRLRAGALIVLEGLDGSGKSTQRQRLSDLPWAEPGPGFLHLPSGLTSVTRGIYQLTESCPIQSPLARQLLHLACQAELMPELVKLRERAGVILDRWWWSTLAYGWYGGHLADAGIQQSVFFGMIDTIWRRQPADVIFLFLTPFTADPLNRHDVRQAYEDLAERYAPATVVVPPGSEEDTTAFIVDSLRDRGQLT